MRPRTHDAINDSSNAWPTRAAPHRKSRVTSQEAGEQGYHAFYYLLAASKGGKLGGALGEQLGLGEGPFRLLNASALPPTEFDRGFDKTQEALTALLGSAEATQPFWRTVGGLLHLGQVEFEEVPQADDDPGSNVSGESMAAIKKVAALWGCTEKAVCRALTTRKIQAGAETCEILKTPAQAASSRDALAKACYEKVFDQLLKECNAVLR